MLLAIETTGSEGRIALRNAEGVVTERLLATVGRRHAQTLVSEAASLLKSCRMRPDQLTAVAVSIGPGSFTGIRVGLVFAKTLAWANRIPLLAVDTLQAIAQQALSADGPGPVTAVSDAQRGEWFAADFVQNPDHGFADCVGPLRIVAPHDLQAPMLVTGPGLLALRSELPTGMVTTESTCWLPTAATVAQIAFQRWQQNQFEDPFLLEPVYVRRSYAEEKRKPGLTTHSPGTRSPGTGQ